MTEADLKQLRASRGYIKASITRLHNFTANQNDVDLSCESILQSKRARLVQLFADYEACNKQILALDEKDNEDVAEIESKYFSILTVLNEATKQKATTSEACATFKAKLPTVQIPVFTGKYSDYTPFINLFRAIVHNDKSIDNVQKLYYLRSFLQKEPLDIVKNLPLTIGSYEEALKLLNDRYNHTFKIVNEHINSLLDMCALFKSTPANLRDFVSNIKQCLAALKNLNINTDSWDPIILAILYRKLDVYTSRAYQLERSAIEDPTVAEFLHFLEKRALALENAEPSSSASSRTSKVVNVTTAGSATPRHSCCYCKLNHKLFECSKFKILKPDERINFCTSNNLCMTCLNTHAGNCRFHFRCGVCKQPHNTLVHRDSAHVSLVSHSHTGQNNILLPTVKVKIYSESGQEIHLKAILDSASQVSLVTSKVIEQLGRTPNIDNTNIVGVSNCSNAAKYAIPLEICSLATSYRVTTNFHVLDKITCKLPQYEIDMESLNIPADIQLADVDFHRPSEINMLIGADIFFQVLLPEPQGSPQLQAERSAKPAAQPRFVNTRFGHVIAGALPQSRHDTGKVSLVCTQCDSTINDNLKQFWEAETVPPIYVETLTEHELCEDIFQNTTILENDKFAVDLPLKIPFTEIHDTLGNSFDFAYYRFLNLEKKLHKNINLLTEYDKFINQYVNLKHGHYIDINSLNFENDPLYFMPHHAVINENSKSTKTRVVFDCSMQTDQKLSLNDILLNGPSVQKELFDIMILYRLGQYTFSTDIQHMFRCVNINPKHASLQNILWRSDPKEPIKCIRLDTVTYGQKSSSFLATRCLQELANKYEKDFPLASHIIKNCTYVDDACFSHSDINVLMEAKQQLIELLSKGSFFTHKWASNDQRVLKNVPTDRQQFDNLELQKNELYLKTLGLTLDVRNDRFIFTRPERFNNAISTKREILSYISKIYDPLGFLSPITMKAKAFMQKIWAENITWDDKLSEPLREEWISFATKLYQMEPFTIDRNLQIPSNPKAVQLVGFADASSTTGYGCAVYLRVVDECGNASLSLLTAKSRINPRNKAYTVPKLELNAMLLLTKLMTRVHETLKLTLDIQEVYLFSDSQIALAWINTEPIKLQAFVANRVKLIRDLTATWRWLYVPTDQNPADCVSRGVDPDELAQDEVWLRGPHFLRDGKYEFHSEPILPSGDQLPEMKKQYCEEKVALTACKADNLFGFCDRFSDLNKMNESGLRKTTNGFLAT